MNRFIVTDPNHGRRIVVSAKSPFSAAQNYALRHGWKVEKTFAGYTLKSGTPRDPFVFDYPLTVEFHS